MNCLILVRALFSMNIYFQRIKWLILNSSPDGYYMAYKPITLSCILLMFIELKFNHCHSCVMFAMKSMSMCND